MCDGRTLKLIFMRVPPQRDGQAVERIQAELEQHPTGPQVRISAESYDETRGWCAIAQVCFPLSQLPILEQALEQMKRGRQDCPPGKIIPFPGLKREPGGLGRGATDQ